MISHPFYVIIDKKNQTSLYQVFYLCYLYSIYNAMIRDYVMAFADYYENSYSKHAWKLKIFESLYGPNYKVKNTLQVPYTEFYYTETSPFCLYAQNNQDYWDGK